MIWNPGQLPEGLSIEMLKGKHPSRPRNKNIADTFFKAGYIEAWGRGFALIFNECSYFGCPEPFIEEFAGGIQVTFIKTIFSEEYLKEIGLNDRQIKAVFYVKEYSVITNNVYQDTYNVSRRTATRELTDLVNKGIFIASGSKGSSVKYKLNDE